MQVVPWKISQISSKQQWYREQKNWYKHTQSLWKRMTESTPTLRCCPDGCCYWRPKSWSCTFLDKTRAFLVPKLSLLVWNALLWWNIHQHMKKCAKGTHLACGSQNTDVTYQNMHTTVHSHIPEFAEWMDNVRLFMGNPCEVFMCNLLNIKEWRNPICVCT